MKFRSVHLLTLLLTTGCGISAAQEENAEEPVTGKPATEEAAPVYLKATETKEIMAKEGDKITVYGNTTGSGKSRSGTNFVNFEDSDFYLITFKTDLIEFLRGEPADFYNDKRIAVTGVVSIFKDKPQFKLTDPSQVQILEADAEFPPKADAANTALRGETETPATTTATKEEPAAEKEPAKKPPVDPKKYFK